MAVPIPQQTNCLGYGIYSDELQHINISGKYLINTINQYSYYIAEKNTEFKHALQASDILLPDGIGITLAVRFVCGKKIKKIAGADMHQYLLSQLQENGGRCFYLGASNSTLQKIKERINNEYPAVHVSYYSPPYKAHFTEVENEQMLTEVNKFKPHVLFIGMTAPKQEKWAFANREMLDANIICSIGAVFDFYAGTIKRPGAFWLTLGLEWFIRLVKEPRRMWKRYLYYGPAFVFMILKIRSRQIFS